MALHRVGLGASALCLAALSMVLLVAHRPMVLDESKALALVSGGGTQKTFSKLPARNDASEERALKLASVQGSLKRFSQLVRALSLSHQPAGECPSPIPSPLTQVSAAWQNLVNLLLSPPFRSLFRRLRQSQRR